MLGNIPPRHTHRSSTGIDFTQRCVRIWWGLGVCVCVEGGGGGTVSMVGAVAVALLLAFSSVVALDSITSFARLCQSYLFVYLCKTNVRCMVSSHTMTRMVCCRILHGSCSVLELMKMLIL